MVMAESERGLEINTTTTTTPTTPSATTTTTPSARLQWLRQRQEALQEKLILKNKELKCLCIDEAYLTGVVPQEIPLEPGESPPILRKRISTSSIVTTCSTSVIATTTTTKPKTSQVEESALELERQVQSEIAKTSLAIVNDGDESKTVRRKHRQLYQQSQRRLKELDTRLNFIRQGYGQLSKKTIPNQSDNWQLLSSTASTTTSTTTTTNDDVNKIATKHRIKKPRPPFEASFDKEPSSSGGSTTSSSKIIERNTIHNDNDFTNTHDYYRSKIRYIKNYDNHTQIDHNADPTIYPDHYRARTYSHGNNIEDSSIRNLRNLQFEDRPYKNSPSMFNLDCESRNNNSNDLQHWQNKKYLETTGSGYLHQHSSHRHPPSHQQQQQQHQQQQQQQQQRFYYQDRLSSLQKLTGQSVYHHGDLLEHNIAPKNSIVSYSYNNNNNNNQSVIKHQDQYYPESIKDNNNHYKENTNDMLMSQQERIPRRNTVNDGLTMTMPRQKILNLNDNWPCVVDDANCYQDNIYQQDKFGSLDRRKNIFPHHSMRETTSPHNRYGVNLSPVEHQQQAPPLPPPPSLPPSPPPHTRVLLRTQSLGSVEKWQLAQINNNNHQHHHQQIESPTGSIRDSYVSRSGGGGTIRDKEWYDNTIDCGYRIPPTTIPRTTNLRYPRSSPSPSSISTSPKPQTPPPPLPPPPPPPPLPPQSSLSSSSSTISIATTPKIVEKDLEIPAESSNHAGKYREVTKPFEMSDVYKYSRNYRKKQEQTRTTTDNNQINFDDSNCIQNVQQRPPISGGYIPPSQRRIYDRPTYPSS